MRVFALQGEARIGNHHFGSGLGMGKKTEFAARQLDHQWVYVVQAIHIPRATIGQQRANPHTDHTDVQWTVLELRHFGQDRPPDT